jgi:hypothetical protein
MKLLDLHFSSYHCPILGALEKLRKATTSCVISVRVSVVLNRSVIVGRIFMKFDIRIIFGKKKKKNQRFIKIRQE